ncbi:PBSX family phage terminase large subunit [Brevibacillus reuszeri]|uniref:PBSX family phage terminase large subunit n=1 Tax=Brevibacillus reuszeri TaxID=54915 RepID=UPI000CCC229B|nr:PBSX family phage terminase large subunit [Brevibacillus reuszeri]
MAKKHKRTTSFKFQPFSQKQKKLLMWWTDNSPYRDFDMVIAEGAIRSGKTIAMIDSFITWSLAKHKHQNFILAGKSMGALKRNVLEPMFQILTAKGIDYHYHRSENPHVIIGTNTYYLFGANNEASQDTLQGLTAAGAYLDEVALFPHSFVVQAIGRCSAETDGNGAKIFFNCNPAGPYHWFKTDYIDKAHEKKILLLHFTMDDNLSLSEKVKERFRRMFSGVFFKRNILGLWVMAEGVVYDMFDEDVHVVDDLPASFDRLFVGGDYGINNPTAFLLCGQKGKDFFAIREYYFDSKKVGKQKTVGQLAEDFLTFRGDDLPEVVFLDPSAAALILELKQKGVTNIKGADNSVIDGIQLVQNLLTSNGGRLFVHRSCVNLIREFFSYLWDHKAQARGEDEVIKENDHALDALRYALFTIWHLLRKSTVREEKRREGKGGWI